MIDMPAHIRTAITHTSENIPINNGYLVLGTWQGIYIWEHHQQNSSRELVVHISGSDVRPLIIPNSYLERFSFFKELFVLLLLGKFLAGVFWSALDINIKPIFLELGFIFGLPYIS